MVFKTKYPGNGAIAIRDDGRVCAIGGWDGKCVKIAWNVSGSCTLTIAVGRIRLYSTKNLKPLGTLAYHKGNCQAVAFARSYPHTSASAAATGDAGGVEEEDEMGEDEKARRSRWLISGGHDHRVALWTLMDFDRTKPV